jgi:hypothetical protein
MANVKSPRGLRIGGPLLGAHWYEVAVGYATSLFIGDPVVMSGTSNQITSATAGSTNKILGAVIGVYDSNKVPGIQASTGERLNYKPPSTAAYVLVADHPMQMFIIQNGAGTGLDKDGCGGNVPLAADSTGNTISGQSAWTLLGTAVAAGSAAEQIRLIRPVDRVDNAVGSYCDWYCMVNNHERNAGIVGVGV